MFLNMGRDKTNIRGSGEDIDGNTVINSFIEESRVTGDNRILSRHLKIIKFGGILFLLLVSTLIPGLIILNDEKGQEINVSDFKVVHQDNETACVFIKQYDIYLDTFVTVCNRYGVVVLDIRRFINDTATIIGIQLSERQWLRLKRVSPIIDRAISEARTYWKDLKVLKYREEN